MPHTTDAGPKAGAVCSSTTVDLRLTELEEKVNAVLAVLAELCPGIHIPHPDDWDFDSVTYSSLAEKA